MRKMLLMAGFIAVIAAPAFSQAATRCEQQQADRKTTGTVIGAIAGGLLGNAVSRGGGKTGGTVIGAAGGAIVGNQLARQNNVCPDGYRAYDDGAGPAPGYNQPAYYSADEYPGERDYWARHHHHSRAYLQYMHDQQAADAYRRDPAAYSYNRGYAEGSWRDRDGRMCSWRDQADQMRDGDVRHHWVEDCR